MTGLPVRIMVAAAVIRRRDEYFVTRRHAGVHLEGFWEFPGGKCEPGESCPECLVREIQEELDAPVRVGAEILSVAHDYPDRVIELHFYDCELLGEPRPMLGQEMRWVPKTELGLLPFPPADAALLELLEDRA
jgi:8-oxo-dGTP diphosphatase